ncbi:MAG TPA: M23 family metallopeptidase [Acidobacteriota bacterium]
MAGLGAAPPAWSAKPAELLWAEPFVVRRGETVALAVEGRRLPLAAQVAVFDEGRPDPSITVLEWERPASRRGRLTIEIAADAPVGLRGLELRPAGGTRLLQTVAFRVADSARLPWPHEPPGASASEREALRDQVFIINNFGLYQASNLPAESYFHDGLDIVLPKATPIYALADGVVRDRFEPAVAGWRSIAVEDLDQPGFGWIYVHTDGFRHPVGDVVRRGEQIAEIADFDGSEHIHLSRAFVPDGRSWSRLQSHHNRFADDLFELRDVEPPRIQGPLYLFRNQTGELLPASDGELVATGDVDIVVAIRDGGHYAHSKDPAFPPSAGDRLAPAVVRCEVLNSGGERVAQWTRDLTRMVLRWEESQSAIWAPERVMVVFKSHLEIPNAQYNSYFVLTNSDGINAGGEVQPTDTAYAWRTAATDLAGERLFPDGRYRIRITAWDSVGNRSSRNQRVLVRN